MRVNNTSIAFVGLVYPLCSSFLVDVNLVKTDEVRNGDNTGVLLESDLFISSRWGFVPLPLKK